MDFPALNMAEFTAFILILVRVSVLVFLAPIFGSTVVPVQIKAGLVLTLSLAVFRTVEVDGSVYPLDTVTVVPLILWELFLGMSIALIIRLVLEGVQLAGQYIGYQMGFAIVNVIDPQTGSQSSVLSQFTYLLAMIIFLSVNGHYIIIKALIESFELAPPGHLDIHPLVMAQVMNGVTQMFILSIKIGAPTLAVLFCAKVSMGIVAKTVPQLNVLFVGMPLYIVVGLLVFGMSLSFLTPLFGRAMASADNAISLILRAM